MAKKKPKKEVEVKPEVIDANPPKIGAPTKYDPKFAHEIIEFFSCKYYREVIELTTYKDGTTKENSKLVANDLPTFEAFASKIDVHRETLINWTEAADENGTLLHPEFFDAYKRAKDLQKAMLIANGLMGNYNPAFAIFTAKNITDMRDKQELDHTTKGDKMPGMNAFLLAREKLEEEQSK